MLIRRLARALPLVLFLTPGVAQAEVPLSLAEQRDAALEESRG